MGGHGAGLDDLAVIPEADDGSHVGLGIQLQEPETRAEGGTGFKVTRLVRGAPGDACGLICEGDVLTAIDHASILFFSFAEVSKALSGREGTAVTLGFERVVRERGALRTRAFEIALRRERFLVADDDAGADGGDGDDDALSLASAREGGGGDEGGLLGGVPRGDGAEGARPRRLDPLLRRQRLRRRLGGGRAPEVPPSPSGSEGGSDVEAHTEARLSAALAAGRRSRGCRGRARCGLRRRWRPRSVPSRRRRRPTRRRRRRCYRSSARRRGSGRRSLGGGTARCARRTRGPPSRPSCCRCGG